MTTQERICELEQVIIDATQAVANARSAYLQDKSSANRSHWGTLHANAYACGCRLIELLDSMRAFEHKTSPPRIMLVSRGLPGTLAALVPESEARMQKALKAIANTPSEVQFVGPPGMEPTE